jgi:hypothetical protein
MKALHLLGSGVLLSFEPPGPQEPQTRWQRRRAYAAAWALHYSMWAPEGISPQKRLTHMGAALEQGTFGFVARRSSLL